MSDIYIIGNNKQAIVLLCSQKGSYITNLQSYQSSICNLNLDNSTITNLSGLASPNPNNYDGRGVVINSTGNVVYNTHDGKIYKRTGDVFALYQTLGVTSICRASKISDNGEVLVICSTTLVSIYKDTGSSFTLFQNITIGGGVGISDFAYNVAINEDCGRIYVREISPDGSNYNSNVVVITRKNDGTYGILTRSVSISGPSMTGNTFSMYARGTSLYYSIESMYGTPVYFEIYKLDYPDADRTDTITAKHLYTYNGGTGGVLHQRRLYVTRDQKYMFLVPFASGATDILVLHIPTSTVSTINAGADGGVVTCSNVDNTKLLVTGLDGIIRLLSVTDSNNRLTITSQVQLAFPAAGSSLAWFSTMTPN